MKKLTLIPVALLLCAGAYGQGTVTFSDNGSTKVSIVGGPANGVTPTGPAGYEVDLLYQANNGGAAPAAFGFNAASSSFTPIGAWQSLGTYALTGFPGEYIIGKVALPGIAGGANVWLEVVGWNNGTTTATSFGTATSGGSTYFGNTAVVTLTAADPAIPTQQPPPLTGAAGFTGLPLMPDVTTPEPTTIALGGIGAAALLLFRRRK